MRKRERGRGGHADAEVASLHAIASAKVSLESLREPRQLVRLYHFRFHSIFPLAQAPGLREFFTA